MIGRYAIQHRKTGERSACPAAPSAASDLDSLAPSSTPRFTQCVPRVSLVDRQPQVRPTNPSLFPVHGRRRGPAQQVEPEVRRHTTRHRLPQATAPDRSTGRQTKHAWSGRAPDLGHSLSVCSGPARGARQCRIGSCQLTPSYTRRAIRLSGCSPTTCTATARICFSI